MPRNREIRIRIVGIDLNRSQIVAHGLIRQRIDVGVESAERELH